MRSLTETRDAAGGVAKFGYLSNGLLDSTTRVGPAGQQITTSFVYDGDNVAFDFLYNSDVGGNYALEHRYLYGPQTDQVLAQENLSAGIYDNSRVYWVLTDNQGTVRDIVDNTGAPAQHYLYSAFGQLLSGDTSLTRYLYTGRELDRVTGLQYNRERWYDSGTGRWLTEDPIAADVNPYRYVGNSPTDATDPRGLQAKQSTVTITASTLKQLKVTFINLKGEEFGIEASPPSARAVSQGILKGILNKILAGLNFSGVGKVLFAQFAAIELATKLQMQTVRSDIDVEVELGIKTCGPSGSVTNHTVTKNITIRLAELDLGNGGTSAHDTTGISNALKKLKYQSQVKLQQLLPLIYYEVQKLYPDDKVVPLKQ